MKYLGDSDPERLSQLEASFHRVRRVVGLGAFYNALPKEEEPERKECQCPRCQRKLVRGPDLVPVPVLLRRGAVNLRQAQREAEGKKEAFYARFAADREKQGKAAEQEKQGCESAPVRGSPEDEAWCSYAPESDVLFDLSAAYPD